MTAAFPGESFVVGTAGHIDHGKSALVKALTSIDPDRLEEEKRRGMTIDLGFAYMDLPSGRHVGVVDVPGHQRFLKNMLAGVHGMDAVLLVIAADEGPMPQTREHLAIIDLLGIEHGVVVLSKVDLVSPEWLRLVEEEAGATLKGSSLAGAPIVAVSSTTGQGLAELLEALDSELKKTTTRQDLGRPRLPIDRAFAVAGFGTVVTGTLVGGALREGDELTVLPSQLQVRVRGLQQHNRSVLEARPGSRTAVNLAGVELKDVQRGDVLVVPGTIGVSRRLDARLTVLAEAPHPVRHRARLLMYHETAEIPVEVNLLDADQLAAGERGWAQLFALEPVVALPGDRFIIRLPSPPTTLAGGVIVDAAPRRHRRRDHLVLDDLTSREAGDIQTRVQLELAKHQKGMDAKALTRVLASSPSALDPVLGQLVDEGLVLELGGLLFTEESFRRLAAELSHTLLDFHRMHPLRRGMPREALRGRTGLGPPEFQAILLRLVAQGSVVEVAAEVALAGHRPQPSPEEAEAVAAMLQELESQPFNPPPLDDLRRRHRLSEPLIQHLVSEGKLIRVGDDLVFSARAADDAVERIRTYLRANGKLTVASARDLLSSSRRYVLPLLEWMDARKITRRVGDDRILRD